MTIDTQWTNKCHFSSIKGDEIYTKDDSQFSVTYRVGSIGG